MENILVLFPTSARGFTALPSHHLEQKKFDRDEKPKRPGISFLACHLLGIYDYSSVFIVVERTDLLSWSQYICSLAATQVMGQHAKENFESEDPNLFKLISSHISNTTPDKLLYFLKQFMQER